jgi:hypothetical protein
VVTGRPCAQEAETLADCNAALQQEGANLIDDAATRPFLPQRDCAALIETYDVERVLADIDADHGDRRLPNCNSQ